MRSFLMLRINRQELLNGSKPVKLLHHIVLVFVFCAGPSALWATPKIVFSPNPVDFGSVMVGAQDSLVLTIRNVGDETLDVDEGYLAKGSTSPFSLTIPEFELAPGDSFKATVKFDPKVGGVLADVLTLETNLPEDLSVSRPVVQLQGEGVGPEIDVSSYSLSFSSQGLGASATANLLVTNRGNDTLRVQNVSVNDVRFVVDATQFSLDPNQARTLHVTYTPDSSRARIDTLYIVNNDFDENTLKVVLDAQETPLQVGNARLTLGRLGSTFPQVGDTLTVSVTLTPSGESVAGVELFFGYDTRFFAPANNNAPFLKAGYSDDRLTILANEIESTSTTLEVAHLSSFLRTEADSITSEGLLTQIKLVVVAPLSQTTRLRVLVEAPLFNTQFITPSGLFFTMPSSNSLGLGNTPPVIHPFPPLNMSEDEPANLALKTLATDAESGPNDLTWSFDDPDSLMVVSITTPDPDVGAIARFFAPANVSGTFAVMAKVADPAGATDSSVVVVDVAPVNDSPTIPVVEAPVDNATGVSMPVKLEWSSSDPDRDDTLTYEVRFGQNELFLDVVAEDQQAVSHTVESNLSFDTVYYWQILVKDAAGAEVASPVWQFTTAPDDVAPVFVGGPDLVAVTDSTADVFWSLNEPATGRIVLGLQSNLSDSSDFEPVIIADPERLITPRIVGLSPGTQYFFQVRLADPVGNALVSDIQSLTTTGEPIRPPVSPNLGDFSGDRLVDFTDFIVFAAVFNKNLGDVEYIPDADFDSDGRINFTDFLVFASVFGNNYITGKPAH